MFRNAPRLPHAYSDLGTEWVQAAPNASRVCLASVRLLSFCPAARRDVMTRPCVRQRRTCPSLQSTAAQDEATRGGKETTSGGFQIYCSPVTYRLLC